MQEYICRTARHPHGDHADRLDSCGRCNIKGGIFMEYERRHKEAHPVLAICYDFDKTLSPDDMQAQGYIQSMGYDVSQFWERIQPDGCGQRYGQQSGLHV